VRAAARPAHRVHVLVLLRHFDIAVLDGLLGPVTYKHDQSGREDSVYTDDSFSGTSTAADTSLFSDFPDDDDDFSCDSDAYSFFDGSLAAASPPTSAASSPAAASWPRGESSGLPTSATFGITAADSVASIAQAFFFGLHPWSSTPSRAAAIRGSRLGRDFVCAHKENSFGLGLICVKD
jgi:hypothetical protein